MKLILQYNHKDYRCQAENNQWVFLTDFTDIDSETKIPEIGHSL